MSCVRTNIVATAPKPHSTSSAEAIVVRRIAMVVLLVLIGVAVVLGITETSLLAA